MKWTQWSFLTLFYLLLGDRALAQSAIVPDQTLGSESSIVQPLVDQTPFDGITGGATRGNALFHSFSQFNIGDRQTAWFLTNPAINNIFVRVTGDQASNILGRLGTRNGQVGGLSQSSASLFFLNPNGIIFGPNGELDLAGSFIATTASSFQFPGGQEFSAINPQAAPILNVTTPLGLQFGQTVGAIELNSAQLEVGNAAKNIAVIGGNVTLKPDSFLYSPTGRVDVGAVGSNELVGFNLNQGEWSIDYTGVRTFQDVTAERFSIFSIPQGSVPTANLFLQARNITLKDGTLVFTSVQGENLGGNISIQASGKLLLQSQPENGRGTSITTVNQSNGTAPGANIQIKAATLQLENGSSIGTFLRQGIGRAGELAIEVEGDIILLGERRTISSSGEIALPSFLDSRVNLMDSNGSTGNITIRARNLTLQDGAQVKLLSGTRDFGKIIIQVDDRAIFSGMTSQGISSGITTERVQNLQAQGTNSGTNSSSNSIQLSAKSLLLDEGASISTLSSVDGDASSVEINASDELVIRGGGIINNSGRFTFAPSRIRTQKSNGIGNAGNIEINTGNLKVLNGASISSSVRRIDFSSRGILPTPDGIFQGRSGEIKITANDVVVDGDSDQALASTDFGLIYRSSEINSGIGSSANAQGGNILVLSKNVSVTNGAQINTSTQAQGNAGSVQILATDRVLVAGNGRERSPDIFNVSRITSEARFTDRGNSGQIQITAKTIDLQNGGSLLTSNVSSIGNAGNISILGDTINITGRTINGDPSGIFSNVTTATPASQAAVQRIIESEVYKFTLPSEAIGNGGTIEVSGQNLNISGGGEISARNAAQGNAGAIQVRLNDRLNMNNGTIRTTSEKTSGGSINLAANGILLRDNSDIQTQVFSGIGDGGNIALRANWIVLLDDSDILAFAKDGKGGNIRFNTRAFFAENYIPRIVDDPQILLNNGQVDINASGATSGLISFPDSSYIQNSLNPLNQGLTDPNQLIAKTCIQRTRNAAGSLYVLGAGGLPDRPGEVRTTEYPTGGVRELTAAIALQPWQKGDPIVEPQGAYQLANGEWVLSRDCGLSNIGQLERD